MPEINTIFAKLSSFLIVGLVKLGTHAPFSPGFMIQMILVSLLAVIWGVTFSLIHGKMRSSLFHRVNTFKITGRNQVLEYTMKRL